ADFAGALEAAETDLIDAYVRGHLAEPERRDFERFFLTSAQRRNKVAFAAALAQVAEEFKPLEYAAPKRASVSLSFMELECVSAVRRRPGRGCMCDRSVLAHRAEHGDSVANRRTGDRAARSRNTGERASAPAY